jgi:hypothetical protein
LNIKNEKIPIRHTLSNFQKSNLQNDPADSYFLRLFFKQGLRIISKILRGNFQAVFFFAKITPYIAAKYWRLFEFPTANPPLGMHLERKHIIMACLKQIGGIHWPL